MYKFYLDVNLLLNVNPDYLGRILAPQVDVLKKIGKKSNKKIAKNIDINID